jgi:hypothetical protein
MTTTVVVTVLALAMARSALGQPTETTPIVDEYIGFQALEGLLVRPAFPGLNPRIEITSTGGAKASMYA